MSFHSVLHLLHIARWLWFDIDSFFYPIPQEFVLSFYKSTFRLQKSQMQSIEGVCGGKHKSTYHKQPRGSFFFGCSFHTSTKKESHSLQVVNDGVDPRPGQKGKDRHASSAGRYGSKNDTVVLATKFDPRHSILSFLFLLGCCKIAPNPSENWIR